MRTRLLELMSAKQNEVGAPITPALVARKTGVSRATIHKWIKDDVARFDETTIVALCRYFSCTLQDLIFIDENTPDREPAVKRGKGKR